MREVYDFQKQCQTEIRAMVLWAPGKCYQPRPSAWLIRKTYLEI